MRLATIEQINRVEHHSNADTLDVVSVKGWKSIVKRDSFKEGDLCIFVQPDSVLPDVPWAEPYRKFSKKRVKAAKIRGVWSQGIVLPLHIIEGDLALDATPTGDFTSILGITKYEEPVPQDLSVRGGLPYQIPKTDEERWQNLERIPYGEKINVTLKIDGQSATYFYKDGDFSVCSRSQRFKDEAVNHWTAHVDRYNIREKLERFCVDNKVNLALRGESYGRGIQAKPHNPHSKMDPALAVFSVYNIDRMEYERINDPYYFMRLCEELDLPMVPIIERATLRESLITYYDELENLKGNPFEGVVINGHNFSFKIINKYYDSQ